MAVMVQPWLLLHMILVNLIISVIPFSSCQPQNIETFYPIEPPSPTPAPSTQNIPATPPPQQQKQKPPPHPESSSSNNKTIVKAIATTAASTVVLAAVLFFFLQRCVIAKRRRARVSAANSPGGPPVLPQARFDGNLEGLIADDNGLDVLYWRKLEAQNQSNSFHKEAYRSPKKDGEEKGMGYQGRGSRKPEPIQEIPLLEGKSSTSHSHDKGGPEDVAKIQIATSDPSVGIALEAVEKQKPTIQPSNPPPPLLLSSSASQTKKTPAPPLPPPMPAKKHPAPTPPAPRTPSESKPGVSSAVEGRTRSGNGQLKLKALHWDKVNTNADHSMVWEKIDNGSFRFNGDLMEALFGYVATTKTSPPRDGNSENPPSPKSNPSAQIVILDARKSQNTAIVIKSLAVSRGEILDALTEGQGLNADTLEKLVRISPTKEEESQILEFDGDPTRLADAESFLFHLLKAIPSAFTRLSAMLFRLNYDSEMLHLKESSKTLELACKELRTRGLFLKLLEAILKAGNRMNAGTARGNAQAFNLTSLRKLSDVKSTDGKTTLLQFVVQEVARSEGKRCLINMNRSLSRNSSMSSNSGLSSNNSASKEEREKEYMKLGLPVIGGLSAQFSSVKKAAAIDCDTFAGSCSALTASTAEFRKLVSQCAADRRGGFVLKMKGFIEAAEEEVKVVKEEQTRVMELVTRTTEYYQAGASKDQIAKQLQLFVIVKDFLGMVDKACIEIARSMQKRKISVTSLGTSSPKSPISRTHVRFPKLPQHFMTDRYRSTSDESDTDS
ncbi:FH2 domain-containing protein [Cephalotus follicularis]|uniref:Formin-like protein n=1 Tax=Cephalotus follicularis TaxID=3775 RepID=A0A1Q3CFP2_CEPFO|nr:FH2 domain-containing protein [Cephalotus follicularis]